MPDVSHNGTAGPVSGSDIEGASDRDGTSVPRLRSVVTGPAHPEDALTFRQWQVIHELALGATADRAADRLGISRKTLRNHLTATYARLGVPSLVGALLVLGWLRVPDQPYARLDDRYLR